MLFYDYFLMNIFQVLADMLSRPYCGFSSEHRPGLTRNITWSTLHFHPNHVTHKQRSSGSKKTTKEAREPTPKNIQEVNRMICIIAFFSICIYMLLCIVLLNLF